MDEYISREETVKTIQYRACQGYGSKEHICERGSCAYCGIMEIMSDISSIEAADVQPVKHGEWIFQGRRDENGRNIYRCSECNFEVAVFPCDITSWRTHEKYCSGCGARMEA